MSPFCRICCRGGRPRTRRYLVGSWRAGLRLDSSVSRSGENLARSWACHKQSPGARGSIYVRMISVAGPDVPCSGLVPETAMPTLFRAMKQAMDGLPVLGSDSRQLGVRVPPNPNADIDLDENHNVLLNGKGMSVAQNWRDLLPHLIPKRLKLLFPGAAGSNSLACFRYGRGPFSPGPFTATLSLVLKAHHSRSGNVVPALTLLQYQNELVLCHSSNFG